MRPIAATSLAVAVACGALAGCGGDRTITDCPKVNILADAARLVQYREGAGRDPSDIEYTATFDDMGGGCRGPRNGSRVEVQVRLVVGLDRGPAQLPPNAAVQYFVAVVDAQRQVLARQEFALPVAFPANNLRVQREDDLQQTIPVAAGKAPGDYSVMIGFQLTHEQLEQNREVRASTNGR